MTDQTLLIIGAVVVAVIYGVLAYANATGKKLEKSVPLQFALDVAEYLAKSTPSTADDDVVKRVREVAAPLLPKPDEVKPE